MQTFSILCTSPSTFTWQHGENTVFLRWPSALLCHWGTIVEMLRCWGQVAGHQQNAGAAEGILPCCPRIRLAASASFSFHLHFPLAEPNQKPPAWKSGKWLCRHLGKVIQSQVHRTDMGLSIKWKQIGVIGKLVNVILLKQETETSMHIKPGLRREDGREDGNKENLKNASIRVRRTREGELPLGKQ